MTLIAAAVCRAVHARMYHLGLPRSTGQYGAEHRTHGTRHRKHYRTTQASTVAEGEVETIPVSKQRYERLSIPMQKAVISSINRVAGLGAAAERDLSRRKADRALRAFILHMSTSSSAENARRQ